MSRVNALFLMICGVIVASFGVFYVGLTVFEGVHLDTLLIVLAWCALLGGIIMLGAGIAYSPQPPEGVIRLDLPLWYEWVSLAAAVALPVGALILLLMGQNAEPEVLAWRASLILLLTGNFVRPIKKIFSPERSTAIANNSCWAAMGALVVTLAIEVGR